MKQELIEKFENAGFKRWTRGDMDRLYLNPETMGLSVTKYKTGNVSSATYKGESISNTLGTDILNSSVWVDIKTGNLQIKMKSSLIGHHVPAFYEDDVRALCARIINGKDDDDDD